MRRAGLLRSGAFILAAALSLVGCKESGEASGPDAAPPAVMTSAGDAGQSDGTHVDDGPALMKGAMAAAMVALEPKDAGMPPPDEKQLGFPPATECADAKKTLAGPQTNQMEMNLHAAAKATVAACTMHAAFTTLRSSLATAAPAAAIALDTSQVDWKAFASEREDERFPHAAEPGYYGSMLNTCYGALDEESANARAAELHALATPCTEPASAAPQATEAAKAADVALNDAYGKVRAGYASEATFLKALMHAQVAWLKVRDAEVSFSRARGEDSAACVQRELARVTSARTDQLRVWLEPTTDGDACGGSYGH